MSHVVSSTETAAIDLESTPLDRAFARQLVRRIAPLRGARIEDRFDVAAVRALDPLLYHTALLVSVERAHGHSCLSCDRWAGLTVVEREGADPFTFPDVDLWRATLRVSGACEDANSDLTSADPLERAPLVLDGTRVYLARFHQAEARLAASIRAKLGAPTASPRSTLFDQLFPSGSADGQREAAATALQSPLVFITGGPGTGKTTMAAKLIALLLEQDPTRQIALAAPTGRAAARLGESMNAAASRAALPTALTARLPRTGTTLHRLLGFTPWDDRFAYHAQHPLAQDVVVVDEASMVDLLLMESLLAAVRPDARLIVLGDPDQLASVDTGFVLGDIVRAASNESAPAALQRSLARLTVSYRFGERPGIGALATAARTGDADAFFSTLQAKASDDIAWQPDRGGVTELVAPLRANLDAYLASGTPRDALAALSRFRILAALRDTEFGVSGLNLAIERWLSRQGIAISGWYHHRPVLITQNDPGTQLFNGDVGATLVIDGEPMVWFDGPDGPRSIAPSRLPAHETAWAMTVHKSQGSEFDDVVLVLPDSDVRLVTRELLYTGITRARKSVTLVGAELVLQRALQRSVARESGLVDRLLVAEAPPLG